MRIRALAATLLGLLCASRAQAGTYTLPELVERVRSDHPGVVMARETVESGRAQLEWVNRQWAPRGDLNMRFGGAPRVVCADYLLRENQNSCAATRVVDQLNYVGPGAEAWPVQGVLAAFNIGVQQPLYTFDKIEAGRKAAINYVEYNRAQLATAQADLEMTAVRTYYTIKWARAAISTAGDLRDLQSRWTEFIRRELETPSTRFNLNDLKRMEIGVEGYEQVLLEDQRGLRNALARLRELTGDPQADLDTEPFEERAHPLPPLEHFVDASQYKRVEVAIIDNGLRALRGMQRVRLAEMLPDLGVTSGFGFSYASSVGIPTVAYAVNNPNGSGPSLALGVQAPLNFAKQLAIRDRAQSDADALQIKRRYYLSAIAFDVSMAHAGAAEAERRRQLTAHAEKIARGWYAMVDEQMAIGVGQPLNLVDAARNYFDLRLRHLQALLDAEVAEAWLYRTAGTK